MFKLADAVYGHILRRFNSYQTVPAMAMPSSKPRNYSEQPILCLVSLPCSLAVAVTSPDEAVTRLMVLGSSVQF